VGYSVSNWVAQFNDFGSRDLPHTPTAATGGAFNLGVTSNVAGGVAPWIINGPQNSQGNQTYYDDVTFGRDVYNVIPTAVITLPGNENMRTMFLAGNDSEGPGSGPAICSSAAITTRTQLGYLAPVQACGTFGPAINKQPFVFGAGTGTPGTNETA
jgi:hypothetical protein